jgi:hypothetical protein
MWNGYISSVALPQYFACPARAEQQPPEVKVRLRKQPRRTPVQTLFTRKFVSQSQWQGVSEASSDTRTSLAWRSFTCAKMIGLL